MKPFHFPVDLTPKTKSSPIRWALIAFLAFLAWAIAHGQTPATAPAYAPNCLAIGMTAATAREGDTVAVWAAKPYSDYARWDNEYNLAAPIPGIKSFPWANDSIGCDLDTSKAGTYSIVKNGYTVGTLKVLPKLPTVAKRVTSLAELNAALASSKIDSLTVITIAPGTYDCVGPDAGFDNVNVPGHVRLVAEIKGAVKLNSIAKTNGYMQLQGGGDLYIEGCELAGKLYATRDSSRLTLTDCVLLDGMAGGNSPGQDHGGTALWNFVAIRCEIRGGLYTHSNTYLKDCKFRTVETHNVMFGGENSAIVGGDFQKCARGIVVSGGKNLLIARNYFSQIKGNGGNAAENVLLEGAASGLCVDQNWFFDSVGGAFQISAEGACRGTIISRNIIVGPRAVAISLYNQGKNGSIDDTAVFGNYVSDAACAFWASPATKDNPNEFGTVSNTRGGNNVFSNQSPTPSHIGNPRIEWGDFNACPASYSDCTFERNVQHPNKPPGNLIAVLKTSGKFYPEQVGVTIKISANNRDYTFQLIEWLGDEKMARVEGWPADAPGPVPAFSIAGPQPVYGKAGFGNTVGWTVAKPFTKPAFINAGDAKVVVK